MIDTVTPRLSTAQIDRLGERLRAEAQISEVDLEYLQAFRGEHEQALIQVQGRIEQAIPGIDQTARIKTIQTLHDKLRRQPTKLSRVQDIAGVRIVQDMDLNEQDKLVAALTREFPNAKVIDRRVKPTFGYRAVHVVVRLGRSLCEIQVRTNQQHLWAEIVERLADRWGRQIRYGGTPDDSSRHLGEVTRREFWEQIVRVADLVHRIEEIAADQNFGVDAGETPEGVARVELEEVRLSMREVLGGLVEFLDSGPEL